MAQGRHYLFRIFYSTSFTAVFFILIALICTTPADNLYQSYKRNRLLDIFLITGAYVITAIVAILIYASRLYTNRSVLKDIPKPFMPIEKEDLPEKRIHKLIKERLEKSAVIAYQVRPRSKRIEDEEPNASARILALINTASSGNAKPRWGRIAHPGWSSPALKDLPNLEYSTVVDELTDLIEAKAVSLAPVDPLAPPGPDGTPLPDRRVVDALTRPEAMGMRQYVTWLSELGVVPDNPQNVPFVAAYERARFSPEPLTDEDFQALMGMFAEILRSMSPVDIEMLGSAMTESDTTEDDELGGPVESSDTSTTYSGSGSVRHRSSQRGNAPPPPPRRMPVESTASVSEDESDTYSLRTAPPAPLTSTSRRTLSSRFVSAASRPSLRSGRSNASLRSTWSSRSTGSVIRLASAGDAHDLPYTIQIPRIETP